MGGQQTKDHHKGKDNPFVLTEFERSQLKAVYHEIRSLKHPSPLTSSSASSCSRVSFQSYCEPFLEPWLCAQISAAIAVMSNGPDVISFEAFQKFIATILKTEVDLKVGLIYRLCKNLGTGSVEKEDTITGSSILQYTDSLVASFGKCYLQRTDPNSCAKFTRTLDSLALAKYILLDLIYPFRIPKDLIGKDSNEGYSDRKFTLDELISGLGKSTLFQNISNAVFSWCFKFNQEEYITKDLIPKFVGIQDAIRTPNFTLLDLGGIIFLNSLLPTEQKTLWRFLFSSISNGESFSKFLSSIQDKGSTVIILRDNSGRIFGGYAPASWKLGPKFFGTSQSFLFHLNPGFYPYMATGYNENFQYLNMQQKTLPNGLGMGGTLNYFGLWIDCEYGHGVCSPSCTTFACPQLSTEKEFSISHLEVWGVGFEPEKEEGIRDPRSILDKDPETRAILEIMGKKMNASDGLREPNKSD